MEVECTMSGLVEIKCCVCNRKFQITVKESGVKVCYCPKCNGTNAYVSPEVTEQSLKSRGGKC